MIENRTLVSWGQTELTGKGHEGTFQGGRNILNHNECVDFMDGAELIHGMTCLFHYVDQTSVKEKKICTGKKKLPISE